MSNSLLHASSIQPPKRLGDPFDGYFKSGTKWTPRAGGLLDISNARRWFEVIGWGSPIDLYTYQQALESKSGPRVQLGGQQFSMISSYDYLGLIGHPAIEAAAIEAIREFGTGTGGVRLLVGTTALHRRFEKELAAFKGTEAAMTFSSGYMANLSIISSLLGPDDRAIIDAKAHRSIVEACRLARVPMQRFHHNDSASLQQKLARKPFGRRTLIVVEGIYSMDGDICLLPDIVELKKQHGAFLMVDEAHSFGVLGATGRGVAEHFGVNPADVDIWMGSLSKAIPANGGFVAGGQDLIIYLQHGAAPFMFSAALCPAAIAAARESLHILQREPERLVRLRRNADLLRSRLATLGYNTGASNSPIIPIIVGADESAYRLARELFGLGVVASAIVKPAVPPGSARLRLCATAAQDEAFLEEIIDGFRKVRDRVRFFQEAKIKS